MIKDDFVLNGTVDINLMRNPVLIDLYKKMPAAGDGECGPNQKVTELAFFTVKNKDGDFSGGTITEFLYHDVRDDAIYYMYSNGKDKVVHTGFVKTLKGAVEVIIKIQESLVAI